MTENNDFPLKVLKKDNNRVIALMILYENINIMILKVLDSIIYCILENYVCIDYIYLQQGLILLAHKEFENSTFNDTS